MMMNDLKTDVVRERIEHKPGEKIVRTFNMQAGLLDDIDRIASKVKETTGLQVDRSKLFTVFAGLLIDSEKHLVTENIVDQESLKHVIGKAIAVSLRRR